MHFIDTYITELSATHYLVCSRQVNSDMLKLLQFSYEYNNHLKILHTLHTPDALSKLSPSLHFSTRVYPPA